MGLVSPAGAFPKFRGGKPVDVVPDGASNGGELIEGPELLEAKFALGAVAGALTGLVEAVFPEEPPPTLGGPLKAEGLRVIRLPPAEGVFLPVSPGDGACNVGPGTKMGFVVPTAVGKLAPAKYLEATLGPKGLFACELPSEGAGKLSEATEAPPKFATRAAPPEVDSDAGRFVLLALEGLKDFWRGFSSSWRLSFFSGLTLPKLSKVLGGGAGSEIFDQTEA